MASLADHLTIGDLARRSGIATSALRFYEQRGLIAAERTTGNQRRYPRATLRTVAIIRAAQGLGLSLEEIQHALDTLPDGRTPTKRDWQRLSRAWHRGLDNRIAELEQLRDSLTGCIGCGCLSLRTCALFNPGDHAATRGAGPRYLLGDRFDDPEPDSDDT
jgi:MerR family redox-sensitive transcriptional activator SoxR